MKSDLDQNLRTTISHSWLGLIPWFFEAKRLINDPIGPQALDVAARPSTPSGGDITVVSAAACCAPFAHRWWTTIPIVWRCWGRRSCWRLKNLHSKMWHLHIFTCIYHIYLINLGNLSTPLTSKKQLLYLFPCKTKTKNDDFMENYMIIV